MQTNNIKLLTTGIVGSAAVEVAAGIQTPTPEDVQSYGQLLIQLVIGIVTLWKMLKKPKPKKDPAQDAE
jgi:hypothetical protein